MARATSSRIRPGIDLNRIIINLDRFAPPTVELHGRVATGNRDVDLSTSVTIKTMALDRVGAHFIEHMKNRFGGDPPPDDR